MPAKIKLLVKPRKLYRYRALQDAGGNRNNERLRNEIRALEDGYIWASNFTAMNDPMEGLYEGDENLRQIEGIGMMIGGNKSSIGITSFSETAMNELMWAHYADNFRGFCVEYDVQRLLANLRDGDVLVRVTYDEKLPQVSPSESATMTLAKQILSSKNYRWIYEREWRLLTDRFGEIFYRDQSCITRILTGSRMSDSNRSRILEIGRRYGINVQNLVVNGYELELQDEDA